MSLVDLAVLCGGDVAPGTRRDLIEHLAEGYRVGLAGQVEETVAARDAAQAGEAVVVEGADAVVHHRGGGLLGDRFDEVDLQDDLFGRDVLQDLELVDRVFLDLSDVLYAE